MTDQTYPPGRDREEGDDFSERVQRSPQSSADRRRELEAELARLDAEDRAGVPAPAPERKAPPQEPNEPEFTHYVHLVDGRVIKHNMSRNSTGSPSVTSSHYVEGEVDDDGTDNRTQTAIIGVYPR